MGCSALLLQSSGIGCVGGSFGVDCSSSGSPLFGRPWVLPARLNAIHIDRRFVGMEIFSHWLWSDWIVGFIWRELASLRPLKWNCCKVGITVVVQFSIEHFKLWVGTKFRFGIVFFFSANVSQVLYITLCSSDSLWVRAYSNSWHVAFVYQKPPLWSRAQKVERMLNPIIELFGNI